MTFRRLAAMSALLMLLGGCAEKQEIQRLTQERENDRILFEKITRRQLQDLAVMEKQLAEQRAKFAEQRAEFDKERKTAQDRFAAQEQRLPSEDQIIIAKQDLGTLKACAMHGVTCMAQAGNFQKAEVYAAFLVKALKGDEDVAKLKETITAQRAVVDKKLPEQP